MSKKKNTENDLTVPYSKTLKRRSAEGPKAPVVNKPRKMKLVKPKRLPAKTMDFANSSMLVFPTDPLGITSEIKAAMIRAGSKVGKDPKTLELVAEVVGTLMKHLEARQKQNAEMPRLKPRVDTSAVVEEKAQDDSEGGSQDQDGTDEEAQEDASETETEDTSEETTEEESTDESEEKEDESAEEATEEPVKEEKPKAKAKPKAKKKATKKKATKKKAGK